MSGADRWRYRLENYRRALAQLREAAETAASRPLSRLEQQGLIQAFEFTHELAWKLLKGVLEERGGTEAILGSRDATKAAFAAGVIEDGELWMEMIVSRNLTTHVYNEATSNEIAGRVLDHYLPAFERLDVTVKSMMGTT